MSQYPIRSLFRFLGVMPFEEGWMNQDDNCLRVYLMYASKSDLPDVKITITTDSGRQLHCFENLTLTKGQWGRLIIVPMSETTRRIIVSLTFHDALFGTVRIPLADRTSKSGKDLWRPVCESALFKEMEIVWFTGYEISSPPRYLEWFRRNPAHLPTSDEGSCSDDQHACVKCGKNASEAKSSCGLCDMAYCSEECKWTDWANHRGLCRSTVTVRDDLRQPSVAEKKDEASGETTSSGRYSIHDLPQRKFSMEISAKVLTVGATTQNFFCQDLMLLGELDGKLKIYQPEQGKIQISQPYEIVLGFCPKVGWCRVMIKQLDESNAEVMMIDHEQVAIVDLNHLHELPKEMASLPPAVFRCQLPNTEAFAGLGPTVTEAFLNVVQSSVVTCEIKEYSEMADLYSVVLKGPEYHQ